VIALKIAANPTKASNKEDLATTKQHLQISKEYFNLVLC
jgi:hypothetical protein